MESLGVTIDDVRAARERIRSLAAFTPLKPAYALSEHVGGSVFFKLETMQPTGAFKLRGAANACLSLSEEDRECGVIAMSSGNHGRALAWVARQLDMRCVVWVTQLVPPEKVAAIRSLGAEVNTDARSQDEATQRAIEQSQKEGLRWVSAFDDPRVIAGQGTLALEIFEQNPEIGTLVVPLSGGGLLAGVAVAAKALRPKVTLLGVSQASGPAMALSMQAGQIVEVNEEPSLADALQGGLGAENRYTLNICSALVDDTFLLEESEILEGMRFALLEERLVLEGGAATGIGLLLSGKAKPRLEGPVAVVLTGDNIDPKRLIELTQ